MTGAVVHNVITGKARELQELDDDRTRGLLSIVLSFFYKIS